MSQDNVTSGRTDKDQKKDRRDDVADREGVSRDSTGNDLGLLTILMLAENCHEFECLRGLIRLVAMAVDDKNLVMYNYSRIESDTDLGV